MGENAAPSPRHADAAARSAAEVTELLEVLWERGRDAVSSSPVSASQLRVLYSLDREEGINLRTLGTLLGSAPSSVSRLCDRLAALGLVERAASPVSRRELELRLTDTGRTYLTDLRRRREEVLQASIDAMPEPARTALEEGLRGLRDAIRSTGTGSTRAARSRARPVEVTIPVSQDGPRATDGPATPDVAVAPEVPVGTDVPVAPDVPLAPAAAAGPVGPDGPDGGFTAVAGAQP
ncbi:hypothetical protein GCM10023347_47650 [Streptomyces chumphonensis]|uniref:MarR family transcriptional regulator n=1 Tax=Streptomyces chumphonensis TaxID=1214925 RepID=A0A927EZN8_9ACTN|nr:MarR family transcriptional regulator [Streptomyces chumphonensis]